MAVTISIGVGLDGLSYSQNYEFSRTAIDLALGRGGDQAVVKTPEQISYYGGKSQQGGERTPESRPGSRRMRCRKLLQARTGSLSWAIRSGMWTASARLLVFYRIARTLDRKAQIVINEITTSVQPLIDMFQNSQEYEPDMFLKSQQALETAGNNTVLVVVDVNKPSITECPELLKVCKSICGSGSSQAGERKPLRTQRFPMWRPMLLLPVKWFPEILQYINDGVRIKGEGSRTVCIPAS